MPSAAAKPLTGVLPIAPTPFRDNGDLDLDGQRRVLDCMIDQGVDAICILANYSEQFLLSDEERNILLELCIGHVRGRVPVIVTCSHFSTRIAAERGRRAAAAGAQMLMLMPPYHGALLRADEKGTFEHFAKVAEAAGIPIMVQDAPLSGVTLSVPLLVRLARELPQVGYFKIEQPGTAAKLRALIEAGGNAIAGALRWRRVDHIDGRPRCGSDRHNAERVAARPHPAGARASSCRPPRRGCGGLRAHPAARQLREPPVRPARDQDRDGRRRGDRERCRAPSAGALASGNARRPARAGPLGSIPLPRAGASRSRTASSSSNR